MVTDTDLFSLDKSRMVRMVTFEQQNGSNMKEALSDHGEEFKINVYFVKIFKRNKINKRTYKIIWKIM